MCAAAGVAWRRLTAGSRSKKRSVETAFLPGGSVCGVREASARRCKCATRARRQQGSAASAMSTHYDLLGVSKEATSSEIKKAFRTQSKKYHPDRFPDDKDNAQKRFDEINRVRLQAMHELDRTDGL